MVHFSAQIHNTTVTIAANHVFFLQPAQDLA